MTTELTPEFAVTVRGYDRAQVDDYVDSLREWLGNATSRMEAAESEAAQLREQVILLRKRLVQLDQQATDVPPKTIVALGDRVTRILQLAEEGAAALRADAEAEANVIAGRAREQAEEMTRSLRAKQADLDGMAARAEQQSAHVLSVAEAKAAESSARLIADAEARVHTMMTEAEAERGRVLEKLAVERGRLEADLRKLTVERDEVLGGLTKLRESLRRTIDGVPLTLSASDANNPRPGGTFDKPDRPAPDGPPDRGSSPTSSAGPTTALGQSLTPASAPATAAADPGRPPAPAPAPAKADPGRPPASAPAPAKADQGQRAAPAPASATVAGQKAAVAPPGPASFGGFGAGAARTPAPASRPHPSLSAGPGPTQPAATPPRQRGVFDGETAPLSPALRLPKDPDDKAQ